MDGIMKSTLQKRSFSIIALGVFLAMAPLLIAAGKPTPARRGANVALGSRAAATAMLTGNFPLAWKRKIDNDDVPAYLQWPLPGRRLGRGFGSDNGRHLAVDITAPVGTPVQVMAPGLITYADDGVKGYGRMVMVLHGGGWVSLYAHLSRFRARPGAWVKRGQVIAMSGNTGISKGPHLHFAVIDNGDPIDPMPFMRGTPKRKAPRIAWLGLPAPLSQRL